MRSQWIRFSCALFTGLAVVATTQTVWAMSDLAIVCLELIKASREKVYDERKAVSASAQAYEFSQLSYAEYRKLNDNSLGVKYGLFDLKAGMSNEEFSKKQNEVRQKYSASSNSDEWSKNTREGLDPKAPKAIEACINAAAGTPGLFTFAKSDDRSLATVWIHYIRPKEGPSPERLVLQSDITLPAGVTYRGNRWIRKKGDVLSHGENIFRVDRSNHPTAFVVPIDVRDFPNKDATVEAWRFERYLRQVPMVVMNKAAIDMMVTFGFQHPGIVKTDPPLPPQLRGSFRNDFKPQANGLILLDQATGITWSTVPGPCMYWSEATAYAASARPAGMAGWRLPTIEELASLMKYERSRSGYYIDSRFRLPKREASTCGWMLWSSDELSPGGSTAWKIDADNGNLSWDPYARTNSFLLVHGTE